MDTEMINDKISQGIFPTIRAFGRTAQLSSFHFGRR